MLSSRLFDGKIDATEALGLKPGAALVLVTVAPFDGPVTLRVGRRTVHLGRRLAQLINVARGKERQS